VLAVPPRPVPTDEEREAFVLEVDGLLHVCPVQCRCRGSCRSRPPTGGPRTVLVRCAPSDRVLAEEADGGGRGTPGVVHRTRMSAARRRVARALRTLTTHLGDLDVVEEVEELARWLEEFHARSWLELDYA